MTPSTGSGQAPRNDADCIFCKIIAGKVPAREVFRDDEIVVLEDAKPQAPTHLLVMPKRHVKKASTFADEASPASIARLFVKAAQIGRERGPDGFRIVINEGGDGGQTVGHLHIHVLAGRRMSWPPG